MKKTALLTSALAAAAFAAVPALAADITTTTTTATEAVALSQQDQDFVGKAAVGGMLETTLGQIAVEKAASGAVQDFGQRMMDDHSEANERLKSIAQQKQIELPQELDDEARQHVGELSAMSGAEFGRAYMELMVKDHEEDIDFFEKQAKEGQDGDLKSFAGDSLPTLQEHLNEARDVSEQLSQEVAGDRAGMEEEPAAGVGETAEEATVGRATPGDWGERTANDIIGSRVVNAQGEDVGEVHDLVMKDDKTIFALVDVGGFLGIGEKRIAVPMDQLQPTVDETILMSGATEDELRQLPEWQEGEEEYAPLPRDQQLYGD